jgi:hypothetical protein
MMVMPILFSYQEFAGRHWETGSVRNYYAYRGVKAPHTGQPYSEAFWLGVSGGIVMGYFSFAYEGYDPQARILTRNTFDPFETMLARMGVVQEIRQTGNPAKAIANLLDALAEGLPAIVWADYFTLPYNALPDDDGMWAMFPILVYGYDEAADQVWIADRARVPLTITTGELAAVRGRVKKVKYRLLTLDLPDPGKLASAVQMGIWDCIKLFTEPPPKGSKNNFGLAAYRWWIDLLTKPKQRMSWAKEFPPGVKMYAGLASTFTDINSFGKEGNAERLLYADFLDEAALILNKPALKEVAEQFRTSAHAWDDLSQTLLSDEVAPFKETRELLLRKHRLFLDQGSAALPGLEVINSRLAAIKNQVAADFPLSEREVVTFRQRIAERVQIVHNIEQVAVTTLKDAMSV